MITMLDVAAGILLAYNLMGMGHDTWPYLIGFCIAEFWILFKRNYF